MQIALMFTTDSRSNAFPGQSLNSLFVCGMFFFPYVINLRRPFVHSWKSASTLSGIDAFSESTHNGSASDLHHRINIAQERERAIC